MSKRDVNDERKSEASELAEDTRFDLHDKRVWNVDFSSDEVPFWQLPLNKQIFYSVLILIKLSIVVGCLYLFICSLSFLASGFRLVAGKEAANIFRNSDIFNNMVAAVLIGVLVTVLVQSSSTSTSIIITMVAADLFTVKQAIPLVMGANIGTSVTSTIVAMAQASEGPDTFERAFAAATVHDMFNWLSVIVFLPLEAISEYLYRLSKAIIDATPGLTSGEKPPEMLKKLTKPFTKMVVGIDKKLISKIAAEDDPVKLAELKAKPILKYLFEMHSNDITDAAAGAIVLVMALAILCVTLFLIVFLLKSILKGRIAVWLHKSVNGNIPDLKCGGCTIPLGWITGYIAMGVGTLITIGVQSSSITTSVLTPLVGVGVIKLERMYPVVLGANVGTCVTGVLAALAADASKLALTLQVAYVHLFFNISGIAVWYVIWPLRIVPIGMAKILGRTTSKYRWFAICYLIFMFLIFPLIFVGLAFAGSAAVISVVAILCVFFGFILIVNMLQKRKPEWLPSGLRTWDWLPEWMRSLAPLDRVVCQPIGKHCCSCFCGYYCCLKKKKRTARLSARSSTTSSAAPTFQGDVAPPTADVETGTASAVA